MSEPGSIYYVQFGGLRPRLIGRRVLDGGNTMPSQGLGERSEDGELSPPGQIASGIFTCKEVSRLFDVSEARLRYWDRSGFVSPTGFDGRRRCYTFQDLIGVRAAKSLLESGVSLQRARRMIEMLRKKLPNTAYPLNRMRILCDAKTVVVADEDCEFEADSGQLLLDFKVKNIEERVVSELPEYKARKKERTAYEWYLEGCRLDESDETVAEAEDAYHRAIHMDPTLANAYTNLGNLLYRTGSAGDARALYEKAIEVDPDQPEGHYNLGFVEFECQDLENAKKRFLRAVELDPTFSDAYFNLAMTLYKLGELDEARIQWQRYLDFEPDGPWADVARERLRDLR